MPATRARSLTGFSFNLVGITRTVNARWHDMLIQSREERDAKAALRQGNAGTSNIYLTSGGGYLGWATFPSSYSSQPNQDGIVVDFRSLPHGPIRRIQRRRDRHPRSRSLVEPLSHVPRRLHAKQRLRHRHSSRARTCVWMSGCPRHLHKVELSRCRPGRELHGLHRRRLHVPLHQRSGRAHEERVDGVSAVNCSRRCFCRAVRLQSGTKRMNLNRGVILAASACLTASARSLGRSA